MAELYDKFQYTFLSDIEAEKLLEAFRLYGTKVGKHTTRNLWLVYSMTDNSRSFFFSKCYYQNKSVFKRDESDITEYAIVSGEKYAVVNCSMKVKYKQVDDKQVKYIEDLVIHDVRGECPVSVSELEEMINFYCVDSTLSDEVKKEIATQCGDTDLRDWNIGRQHRLMRCNHKAWKESGEILAKDYKFVLLDREQQEKLWKCIVKHANPFKHFDDAELGYALTDEKNSFLFTFCYFMPDGIKHCNEPDDYEYAIVTKLTKGVVHSWGLQIKDIKGIIPFPEEKIQEMIAFYREFHSKWKWNYEKENGKISKRPYNLEWLK